MGVPELVMMLVVFGVLFGIPAYVLYRIGQRDR